jgi:hypothetical protein
LSCVLTCPKGVNFEYSPAPLYKCRYEFGEFEPKLVPRCVYGRNTFSIQKKKKFISLRLFSAPGVQVVHSNPIEHYSQTIINGTKKGTGSKKVIVEEIDDGSEEIEEEIEETIITKKKTTKKKKGSKTYVRLKNFFTVVFV